MTISREERLRVRALFAGAMDFGKERPYCGAKAHNAAGREVARCTSEPHGDDIQHTDHAAGVRWWPKKGASS